MIDFSSIPQQAAGQRIVFATEPKTCCEIVCPAWATSCQVGADSGPCWVINNPAILDGMTVIAPPYLLIDVSDVDPESGDPDGVGIDFPLSGGKLCSGAEQPEPESWPTGCWVWVKFNE